MASLLFPCQIKEGHDRIASGARVVEQINNFRHLCLRPHIVMQRMSRLTHLRGEGTETRRQIPNCRRLMEHETSK